MIVAMPEQLRILIERGNAEGRKAWKGVLRIPRFRVSAIQGLTTHPPHYLALCQPQIDALSFFASAWLRMALNGRLSMQGRKRLKLALDRIQGLGYNVY